ncbi:MAG TPA: glycosyltransferase family 2 protein [Actinocrinis sp.]|jgi:cellulose synthase/poly-beta-1,6-N-acetylglucosamine synthase-like glycosyltransferase|uniref:glycosyltransferase family 2 protein n=1 Tax=Actinocrinis sp. TaxID=1920516 RepID=UPI002DDD41E8|nr:glycosyltransferase family 2 protein [Actinocrinis sp.]HEV3174120.1 glycosyltransferase family 2 protein [Actinocrinis sp.]
MTIIHIPMRGQVTASESTETATLPDELSARRLLGTTQTVGMALTALAVVAPLALRAATGLGPSLAWWGQAAVAVVTVIYVAVIGFKLALVFGAGGAPVLRFEDEDLTALPDEALPLYTLLVPLHREGAVLPTLLKRLSDLDYPAEKLQVLLLIEQDDDETLGALAKLDPGPQFETVIIPPEGPRTKPKACNVGLRRARGEFCVIYDAEDRPDRDQLRKAVLAFRTLPDRVVCVQAELQYWNPWTNWLTRCFAAEYATNFSLSLRGLDRHRLAIPLGGTSNHFRTDALRRLGAWDPYNVTEDADLGIRIARRGWDVRMMVSVTEEEANSKLGNWIRQRSRWIKGYYQTWLVHMRNPWRLWRELGTKRFLAFHLTVGFSTFTTLVNPVFWALTVLYLTTGTKYLAVLFPAAVLYLGMATMVIGNLLMCYCLMTGCMERGLHRGVRAMLSVPLYWGLMSVASFKAMGQLIRPSRRHYWELTEHGLVEEESVS